MNGLQKFPEQAKYPGLDVIANIIKDSYHSFTVHSRGTVESYLQKRIEIHLHFLVGNLGNGAIPDYYCLTFNHCLDYLNVEEFVIKGEPWTKSGSNITDSADEQQAMLVDIREFVQHPKLVAMNILPSLIRLQILDDCLSVWMHAANSSVDSSRVGMFEDGEFRFLRDICGERAARIALRESEGQMVKGPSQIMKDIANQNPKGIIGDRVGLDAYLETIRTSIRVFLIKDMVVATVRPERDLMFQIIQVTTRPLKLQNEVALDCHNEVKSGYEKESENEEGRGNPHPEAGRLLQESEESRHAFTVQRHQEVTAQTAPSHLRGDCTATHTRSNNPEDAS